MIRFKLAETLVAGMIVFAAVVPLTLLPVSRVSAQPPNCASIEQYKQHLCQMWNKLGVDDPNVISELKRDGIHTPCESG
jgi:hypothetical protein